MTISYSKLFVGISLPALCTGLAGLILCSSAHAQIIRPSTQKELKVFDPTASATGNVGIRAAAGTVSYTLTLPAAAPSVNQVLSANAVSGGTVSLTWATPFSGTGTTNYLSKFASAGTLTNSLLFDNGTNVGIGTTSPEAKLNIVNTVSANTPQYGGISELDFTGLSSNLNESFGFGATINFKGSSGNDSPDNKGLSALSVNAFNSNTGTVDYMQGMYGDIRNLSTGTVTNFSGIRLADGINSGTITNFYGLRIEPQTVGTNRQAISLNNAAATNVYNVYAGGTAQNYFAGNVGIGTTSPSRLLEISFNTDNSALTDPRLIEGISIRNASTNTGTYSAIRFDGGSQSGIGSRRVNDDNQDLFIFSEGGSFEKVTFKANGRVGIGTTNPSASLEVRGAGTTSATTALVVGNLTGTSLLTVRNDGYVGIGTTSPRSLLEIYNNAWSALVLSTGNSTTNLRDWSLNAGGDIQGGLSFQVGSSAGSFPASTTNTKMFISSSGNVGIGTIIPTAPTAPTARLEVRGAGSTSATTTLEVDNSSGTSLLTVRDDGNVGIGTTSPNSKLQIVGPLDGGRGASITQHYMSLGENGGDAATILGNNIRVSEKENSDIERFASVADPGNFIRLRYDRGITFHTNITSPLNSSISNDTLERVRIALNGNVGIGTTGPSSILHTIASGAKTANYIGNLLTNTATSTTPSIIKTGLSIESTGTWSGASAVNRGLYVNATGGTTNYAAIFESGNVLIGKTSSSISTNGIELNTNGSGCFWTGSNATLLTMNRIGTNDHLILFKNDGTDCGAITITGANTINFNSSSDYRLKEDLKDFNGLALVSKIPVYDFQWKRDSTRSYGVMAHELQSVLPYAVSGTKDGENTQGVDYSKIVPLLVKAIQEQQVQLGQLKAEQTATSSLLRQLQLDLQSIQKPNTVHKE
jgi:hypothetical protein